MTEILTIWIFLVLICHFSVLISGADVGTTLYRKVGGEVTLAPGAAAGAEPIKSIVWMHGSDFAVEWYGVKVEAYPHFKGRCQLSTATGVLTCNGLTREDSGWYTVEINNNHTTHTRLQVMFPVPKPTVSASCDPGLTHCVLTCDGNTTHTEPVTYSWNAGDTMKMPSFKELNITWEEHYDAIEFSCMMINQVSKERSERIINPFRIRHRYVTICVVFAFVVVVVTVIICRCKAGKPDGADKDERRDEPKCEANGAAADQVAVQAEGKDTQTTPMMPHRQTAQSEGIAEDVQAEVPENADET